MIFDSYLQASFFIKSIITGCQHQPSAEMDFYESNVDFHPNFIAVSIDVQNHLPDV